MTENENIIGAILPDNQDTNEVNPNMVTQTDINRDNHTFEGLEILTRVIEKATATAKATKRIENNSILFKKLAQAGASQDFLREIAFSRDTTFKNLKNMVEISSPLSMGLLSDVVAEKYRKTPSPDSARRKEDLGFFLLFLGFFLKFYEG